MTDKIGFYQTVLISSMKVW